MFSSGPAHRFVAEVGRAFTRVESIWAGGTSGQLGHSDYTLFLRQWLANEAVPLPLGYVQPRFGAREVQTLVPGAERTQAVPGRLRIPAGKPRLLRVRESDSGNF